MTVCHTREAVRSLKAHFFPADQLMGEESLTPGLSDTEAVSSVFCSGETFKAGNDVTYRSAALLQLQVVFIFRPTTFVVLKNCKVTQS